MSGISLDFKDNPVVVPGDGTGKEVGNILDRDHNAYLNRLYLYNGTNTRTQISASGGGSFVTNLGVDNIQPAGAIPFGSGVAKDVASDQANLSWNNTTKTLFATNSNFTNTTINTLTVNNLAGASRSTIVASTANTAAPRYSLVAGAPNAGLIKTLTFGPNMSVVDTPNDDILIDSLAGGGGGIASAGGPGASLVVNPTTVRRITSPLGSINVNEAGSAVELETAITSAGAGASIIHADGRRTKSLTSTGGSVNISLPDPNTVNLEVNPSGVVQSKAGASPRESLVDAGLVKRLLSGNAGLVITDNTDYLTLTIPPAVVSVDPAFFPATFAPIPNQTTTGGATLSFNATLNKAVANVTAGQSVVMLFKMGALDTVTSYWIGARVYSNTNGATSQAIISVNGVDVTADVADHINTPPGYGFGSFAIPSAVVGANSIRITFTASAPTTFDFYDLGIMRA